MIIDLSITNFRSIKDEQLFSLYAETPGTYLTNNIAYPSGNKIGVLKCAGFYGANASGKSNFLKAFAALEYIVLNSGDLKENESIPVYEPFLLADETKTKPVQFEVEFVIKAVRYVYTVSFNQREIIEERLVFYPVKQPAVIFDRKKGDSWKDIKFGSLYKGGTKRISLFPNHAYLSKAGNSAETPAMIRDVYAYFRGNLLYLGLNDTPLVEYKHSKVEDVLKNKIAPLLSFVDTGIASVETVEASETEKAQLYSRLPENIPEPIKQRMCSSMSRKFMFAHQTHSGESLLFDQRQESEGSLRLFSLAPVLIHIITNGGVLILDELDHSMHPFIAELIIKLFNDSRVNKNNAQLIFTTHNINLMSPDLLRRDQIWFVEKNKGVTRCYSLDNFDKKQVKPTSPFNQWYAEGRFGAVPSIDYESIAELFLHKEEEKDA
ncbi:MAG: hypothetical protein RL368_2023 [Pseudomonadota bacterium]|jgi:AAA15 family ATPase/GTPase